MEWVVQNARNTDVERQHLNKILAEIRASIVKFEQQATIIKDVEATVGGMLTGEQTGIRVSYDPTKKSLNFVVRNFTIRLTGDVTGTGTVTGLGDVNIVTTLDEDVGISDAPNDGSAYWRRALAWEEVPVLIEQLATIEGNGLLVATDDGVEVREIEGTAGNIDVADGDGVAGNPVIDLADLPDNGTGVLLAIDRDSKGRVEGSRIATPDDIPHPFHTYMVDENGDYLVDEEGNFIISDEFDISDYALITQTITDGDTTHSPSGDAVYDALAAIGTTQTYTPVIEGSLITGTGTYTTQLGHYTQIGSLVFFKLTVAITAHTGTGTTRITLPVTSANDSNNTAISVGILNNFTTGASTQILADVLSNSNHARILGLPIGGGTTAGQTIDSAFSVTLSGFYFV